MKLTKSKLTELLKTQCDLNMTCAKITIMTFLNPKDDDCHFQLNYKGFHLMKYAKFKYYKIRLKNRLSMKNWLTLDRNCPSPYYINGKKNYVYMFAEKPAVLLQLLDGDLDSFQL
tara:strand:+ start:4907 stop:5251 length:345 start_codon:yes stop_codon:yes gene_type:complete